MRTVVHVGDGDALIRAGLNEMPMNFVNGLVRILSFGNPALVGDQDEHVAGILQRFQCFKHRWQDVKLIE